MAYSRFSNSVWYTFGTVQEVQDNEGRDVPTFEIMYSCPQKKEYMIHHIGLHKIHTVTEESLQKIFKSASETQIKELMTNAEEFFDDYEDHPILK